MKLFGGILSPSVGSDQRFDIFDTVVAGGADFAAAVSILGQTMSECLKHDVEPLFCVSGSLTLLPPRAPAQLLKERSEAK